MLYIKFHISQKTSHSLEIRDAVAGKTGCLDLPDQLTLFQAGDGGGQIMPTTISFPKFVKSAHFLKTVA